MPRTRPYTPGTSCVKPATRSTPEREITLRWYDALVHLDEAEDGLRMNELAGRTPVSKSRLTRVIDRMDEAGPAARAPTRRPARRSMNASSPLPSPAARSSGAGLRPHLVRAPKSGREDCRRTGWNGKKLKRSLRRRCEMLFTRGGIETR